MSTRAAAALVLVVAWASPASADWAYTHWGMSADEVVKASGGTAKLLAKSAQTRNTADRWVMAADGTHTDGAAHLQVGFMFDTGSGGLKCVVYNAQGNDVAALRQALEKRYGKPAEDNDFGSFHSLVWQKPDAIEFAMTNKDMAAAVTQCDPAHH